MTTPLTEGEQQVLAALEKVAGAAGSGYRSITLDGLLTGHLRKSLFTRAGLARTLGALQRKGCTSKITTGGKAAYMIMPHGSRSLAEAQQPEQAAEDADAWAGHEFGRPAGEITVPCQFIELAEGERVCTIYDLPGTFPILALGITTTGRLLYGVRQGKGWAFEPQWVGICGARPSQLQDVLEQVQAELHVIDRQNHPSELRTMLRKQLRLQTTATLRDLEGIFPQVERRTLIGELARMRDDGEVRFQGARYVWTGKAS